MNTRCTPRRAARIARWVARIWSALVFSIVLYMILTPDAGTTRPPPADWFLLGLWGLAVLGLMVAWRWEQVGGLITIGAMVLREAAWVALKGGWLVNFLIAWAFIVPPALLFLVAWRWERRARQG